MGICLSKVERQEMVARCKARKKYIKQFVKSRHAFSAAHSFYLRSLRSTGSALLQFASEETALHNHNHNHHLPPIPSSPPPPVPPTPPPPPPPPPMSPSTVSWTTSTTGTATTSSAIPPPPPPPVGVGSTWDFWDPFVPPPPSSSRSGTEEEWEEMTTTTASEPAVMTAAASVTAPTSVVTTTAASSELAVVVSARTAKDLAEIVREIDEYFLKAAEAGGRVSLVLEIPSPTNAFTNQSKIGVYGRNANPMLWGWSGSNNGKFSSFQKMGDDQVNGGSVGGGGFVHGSHCSTVERLYAWEKKLFLEVKNAERIKMEHEKKVEQVRRMEVKRADYMKTEKTKKEVEKLESLLEVASQAIDTTSAEIIKLRETQLYPQLLLLVKGLMLMWRSMYESHQVQMHIVDQLKFLNAVPSTEPTSEIHRQSTLQLELELQQWHQSFCNLVKSQRDYIQSLTGWLRLSLFQINKNPLHRARHDSAIYALCEEWQLAIDHAPDKVASEGIKSLLTVVHAIVVQQAEEHKQKKKSEAANKELEKKAVELRSLENKYGSFSLPEMSNSRRGKDPVSEKRAKVETLKVKAEEEKAKCEKAVSITRAMTLNNLQMGLPHAFQAITGFASVYMHAFESVYNQAKCLDQENEVKRLMPN
ncbi:hypothetical protein V2J09_021551 [Rumex salicifolius]